MTNKECCMCWSKDGNSYFKLPKTDLKICLLHLKYFETCAITHELINVNNSDVWLCPRCTQQCLKILSAHNEIEMNTNLLKTITETYTSSILFDRKQSRFNETESNKENKKVDFNKQGHTIDASELNLLLNPLDRDSSSAKVPFIGSTCSLPEDNTLTCPRLEVTTTDEVVSTETFIIRKDEIRHGLIKSKTSERSNAVSAKRARYNYEHREKFKSTLLEQERRNEGLSSAISSTNKGFEMLTKMGYQQGEAIGKSGRGILEPIGIVVKMDRGGLGREAEPKQLKQRRQEIQLNRLTEDDSSTVSTEKLRKRMTQKVQGKQTEADLGKCQIACEKFDQEGKVEKPPRVRNFKGRKKGYECSSCAISFPKLKRFNIHNFEVHGINNKFAKQVKCTVCAKYVANYDEHLNKHLGIRDYCCQVCDKTFHRAVGLEQHKKNCIGAI